MEMEPLPPQDHETRNRIETFVSAVAKYGDAIESKARIEQAHNDKFSFLFGGEHCQYYQFRLNQERSGFYGARGNQYPPPSYNMPYQQHQAMPMHSQHDYSPSGPYYPPPSQQYQRPSHVPPYSRSQSYDSQQHMPGMHRPPPPPPPQQHGFSAQSSSGPQHQGIPRPPPPPQQHASTRPPAPQQFAPPGPPPPSQQHGPNRRSPPPQQYPSTGPPPPSQQHGSNRRSPPPQQYAPPGPPLQSPQQGSSRSSPPPQQYGQTRPPPPPSQQYSSTRPPLSPQQHGPTRPPLPSQQYASSRAPPPPQHQSGPHNISRMPPIDHQQGPHVVPRAPPSPSNSNSEHNSHQHRQPPIHDSPSQYHSPIQPNFQQTNHGSSTQYLGRAQRDRDSPPQNYSDQYRDSPPEDYSNEYFSRAQHDRDSPPEDYSNEYFGRAQHDRDSPPADYLNQYPCRTQQSHESSSQDYSTQNHPHHYGYQQPPASRPSQYHGYQQSHASQPPQHHGSPHQGMPLRHHVPQPSQPPPTQHLPPPPPPHASLPQHLPTLPTNGSLPQHLPAPPALPTAVLPQHLPPLPTLGTAVLPPHLPALPALPAVVLPPPLAPPAHPSIPQANAWNQYPATGTPPVRFAGLPLVPPPPIQPIPPPIQPDLQAQERIRQLRAAILESETNLKFHYQSLIDTQLPLKIDETIEKAMEDDLKRMCEDHNINLNEFDRYLEPIVEHCKETAIFNATSWVLTNCVDIEQNKAIAKHLLKRILSNSSPFDSKLRLIYLIDAFLRLCMRKNCENLLKALCSVIIPAFCYTMIQASEDKKPKLRKVFNIWRNHHYVDDETLDKMEDPEEAMKIYKFILENKFADKIKVISKDYETQYDNFKKQHQEFVRHNEAEIAKLENPGRQMPTGYGGAAPTPIVPFVGLNPSLPTVPPLGLPLPAGPPMPPQVPFSQKQAYFEMPVGVMLSEISIDDFEYKPLDPNKMMIPPLAMPTPQILEALDNFFATRSHESPRDALGFEKNGLDEFYKLKAEAREKYESIHGPIEMGNHKSGKENNVKPAVKKFKPFFEYPQRNSQSPERSPEDVEPQRASFVEASESGGNNNDSRLFEPIPDEMRAKLEEFRRFR